jgi:hypothetical protein
MPVHSPRARDCTRDRDRDPAAVHPASELVAELGGTLCPSLSGLLERLIDRQAADAARGVRP